MVEGGGGVGVGVVAIEGFEELESFGTVVPEAFEDSGDQFGCPLNWVVF